MAIISIENMEFYAYHGCFEEEQKIGTRFQVDLNMEVDTSLSENSDNLMILLIILLFINLLKTR